VVRVETRHPQGGACEELSLSTRQDDEAPRQHLVPLDGVWRNGLVFLSLSAACRGPMRHLTDAVNESGIGARRRGACGSTVSAFEVPERPTEVGVIGNVVRGGKDISLTMEYVFSDWHPRRT
jgi:hypothetical protein